MKFSNQSITRTLIISGMMLLAAFTRLIPHPANFTAILAIALFGGAKIKNISLAVIIPLTVMFLTDMVFGFHSLMPLVYSCIVATALIGMYLSKRMNPLYVIGGSVASSTLFYFITNGGVWFNNPEYPQTISGLFMCFDAGLPFYRNQLFGDLFFNMVLFGSFAFISRKIHSLTLQASN